MAEVKLSESEIWRVVEAGLYILGYTDTVQDIHKVRSEADT